MIDHQCYICLEACINEQSPCQCQAPIHHACFVGLPNREECTICREPYVYEPFEIITEVPEETVLLVRPSKLASSSPLLGLFLTVLGLWYLFGVVGKVSWLLVGGALTHDILEFWNLEQVNASIFTFLTGLVLFCLQKCLRKCLRKLETTS
jgi:hypothetical protein